MHLLQGVVGLGSADMRISQSNQGLGAQLEAKIAV